MVSGPNMEKENSKMNEEMIAYCGLTCSACPAFLATRAGDEAKARETAELWTKLYHTNVKVEDVWCDGCLVEGRKCAHCGECKIRACAREKGVASCALCADYVCKELEGLLSMVPEARAALERIRARS
jgi:hypothetical protein